MALQIKNTLHYGLISHTVCLFIKCALLTNITICRYVIQHHPPGSVRSDLTNSVRPASEEGWHGLPQNQLGGVQFVTYAFAFETEQALMSNKCSATLNIQQNLIICTMKIQGRKYISFSDFLIQYMTTKYGKGWQRLFGSPRLKV